MSAEILPLIDFKKVKKKRRNEEQGNDNYEELEGVILKKGKGKKKGKNKTKPTGENEELKNTNGLYSYELLLDRVYEKMKDFALSDSMSISLKLPQIEVAQGSGGKSSWVNFQKFVDALGRGREHLYQYFKDDFGIEASLGQSGEILFKKKVTDIMVKNTLRKYLDSYVKCSVCKSYNTILKKDQRLLRIFCLDCKGEKTIQPLKSRGVPGAGAGKKKK